MYQTLRRTLPWLIAICCCSAVFLLTYSITSTVLSRTTQATSSSMVLRASDEQLFPYLSTRPTGPGAGQLLSILPLSPSSPRTSPLVAAVIENHREAREHQQGLHEALVVFEFLVEGDISRFLALYSREQLPERIGPIRSLRPYFISVLRPYKPLLLHAGGSELAYRALQTYTDIPHHDGIRYDGETYERDPTAAAPHNLFMSKEKALSVLEEESVQEVAMPLFTASNIEPTLEPGNDAQSITIDFGNPVHNVIFTYTTEENRRYHRSMDGAPDQASPKNILILETEIEGYGNPHAIPSTKTFGEGRLLLFRDGKEYGGTWQREKDGPFQFFARDGTALPLAPGQVWIMLQPSLEKVH